MTQQEKERMQALVKEVNHHSYLYNVLDKPVISDKEYDKLFDELAALEASTGVILPDSPTQRAGGSELLSGFKKHKHEIPLLSLDKAQTYGALETWVEKIKKEHRDANFVVEYKFDGLRLVLTYENGLLKNASTRGNGTVGEEVTEQVKTIKSVPLSIQFKGKILVEGEGMMTVSAFKEYNKTAAEPLKNPRNGVAGAIRNLDTRITASRNLSFFAYEAHLSGDKKLTKHSQMREFLTEQGFLIHPFYFKSNEAKQIAQAIQGIDESRDKLDIMIDGAVIKVDEYNLREQMGFTNRFPKWGLAYKFEAQEVTSKIVNVIWQVGRTGKLTPLAEIEPVELAGATIRRATLNNFDDIVRKKVKINSSVFVRRSNEVIPEILGLAQDYPDSKEIEKPVQCPCCKTAVIEEGAHLFCPNINACPDQLKEKIIHFCSRNAFNIEGVSDKTVDAFYSVLKVRTVDQLFTLAEEQIKNLDKFKQKKTDNFFKAITQAKNVAFESFIYALGIQGVGVKTAKDLAKRFKNYEELVKADYDELRAIRDIGDVGARSIYEFFRYPHNKKIIKNLFNEGVNIKYPDRGNMTRKLNGLTFVLTGTLPTYSREHATKMIEQNGGQVASAVSSKTSMVLAGENAGSKLDKARSLGVKIIDENEFNTLLK